MKNRLILAFLLLPFLFSFSFLEETIVEHDISEVTLYLNCAEVTRTAKTKIPAGKSDLLFKGISNRIDIKGIKLSFSDNVKTYAISVEEEEVRTEKNKDWLALETQVNVLKKKRSTINISISTLEAELDYLEANYKINNKNITSTAELDEWAEHFRNRVKELHVKTDVAEDSLVVVNKQIKALSKKQSKLEEKIEKTTKVVRVTVVSDAFVESNVMLRYIVGHAVWSPTYTLRADDKNDQITIDYQAQIFNDTGNNWDNKPITLAIINPSHDISKPTLDAWVLDNKQDRHKWYKKRHSRKEMTLSDVETKDPVSYTTIEVDDLSTRFELDNLHLIPSDAKPHLVDIKQFSKKAEQFVLTIPEAKDGAYLIARIFDWQNAGFLTGPMNLYYKDDYQGVTRLDASLANDTLELSLGRDNSFSVAKQKISSKSSEKLIGFNIKEVLTYDFVIKNNKDESATIELRDQLPVSVDKSVEVKALELSGGNLDPLNGILKWKLDLGPNETKRIRLSFSVKYPKSKRGILKDDKWKIVTPRFF